MIEIIIRIEELQGQQLRVDIDSKPTGTPTKLEENVQDVFLGCCNMGRRVLQSQCNVCTQMTSDNPISDALKQTVVNTHLYQRRNHDDTGNPS